jgi:putative thioredoxin
MADSPWIIDVVDADFESAVLERSRELPVVVDFWADWCQPCRVLAPVLEALATEKNGAFLLAKVDVDAAPQSAGRYSVAGIPAVKAFKNGDVVRQFEGVLPEADVRRFLDSLEPTGAEKLIAQARDEKDDAEVERLLRSAVELEPANATALVLLATWLIEDGHLDEVESLIERAGDGGDQSEQLAALRGKLHLALRVADLGGEEAVSARVDADPESPERLYELGCVLAHRGEHVEALATLVRAAEGDKALAQDRVRETMVQIFFIIGARSEIADEYRSRLSRVLY